MPLSRALILHFLIGLMTLLITSPTWAGDKYMFVFGGAGDPPDEKNDFTKDFIASGQFAGKNGWIPQVLFNGAHPEDLESLTDATKLSASPFSQENYLLSLKWLSNQAKPKDKVLIVINSHGQIQTTGESSHKVACNDGDCSLDQLKSVVKNLESRNVQVAIADFSCYSGATLSLASSKTCVITGASQDDTGFSGFSGHFLNSMKPGKSLEDVFLQARMQSDSYGRPEISSIAGLTTKNKIEKIDRESKVSVKLDRTAVVTNAPLCAQTAALREQLKTIQELKDIQSQSEAYDYVDASEKYQKVYQQAQALAVKIKSLEERPVIDSTGLMWTWGGLYRADDQMLQQKYPTLLAIKKDLAGQNSDYQKLAGLHRQFSRLTQQSWVESKNGDFLPEGPLFQPAIQAQQAEKKVFDKIYRAEKNKSKAENPCADFIL